MSNVVPLSAGNSAELRAPSELTERQRRPVSRAMALVSPEGQAALEASRQLTEDDKAAEDKRMNVDDRKKLQALVRFSPADVDLLNEVNDVAVVAFVKHWTRAEAVTLESVLDLPTPDYDALRSAVAPLVAELFVSFAANKNADSPTAPSSASATRSEGEAQIVSPTSGGPTSSSASA